MKISRVFSSIIYLTVTAVLGQSNLNGRVVDLFGEKYEFQVSLKPTNTDTIELYQVSDSLGNFIFENIQSGKYVVSVSYATSYVYDFEHILDSIKNDTLVLNVPVCDAISTNGVCPKCNRSDMVYRIAPKMIFDIWFKSKRDEKRYRRKIIKQGYELTDEENGYITWIEDLNNELFYDVCKHWFCIRDKTLF